MADFDDHWSYFLLPQRVARPIGNFCVHLRPAVLLSGVRVYCELTRKRLPRLLIGTIKFPRPTAGRLANYSTQTHKDSQKLLQLQN